MNACLFWFAALVLLGYSKAMGKKKRDLFVSSGRIGEEDLCADIDYWQKMSSTERFRVAQELAEFAHSHKSQGGAGQGKCGLDKSIIEYGSLSQ